MRSRIILVLLSAAAISAAAAGAAWAQTAPAGYHGAVAAQPLGPVNILIPPATAPLQVGGTVKIAVTIKTNKNIPDGTVLDFGVSASVVDTSFTNTHSIGASATVSAGVATASIVLPYIWVVTATSDTMGIECGVTASVSGADNYYYFDSLSAAIPLPKNGATTVVKLAGTL